MGIVAYRLHNQGSVDEVAAFLMKNLSDKQKLGNVVTGVVKVVPDPHIHERVILICQLDAMLGIVDGLIYNVLGFGHVVRFGLRKKLKKYQYTGTFDPVGKNELISILMTKWDKKTY